jgi:hypothetical protein
MLRVVMAAVALSAWPLCGTSWSAPDNTSVLSQALAAVGYAPIADADRDAMMASGAIGVGYTKRSSFASDDGLEACAEDANDVAAFRGQDGLVVTAFVYDDPQLPSVVVSIPVYGPGAPNEAALAGLAAHLNQGWMGGVYAASALDGAIYCAREVVLTGAQPEHLSAELGLWLRHAGATRQRIAATADLSPYEPKGPEIEVVTRWRSPAPAQPSAQPNTTGASPLDAFRAAWAAVDVGMTEAQVGAILGPGQLTTVIGDDRTYEWPLDGRDPGLGPQVLFRNGRVAMKACAP